MDIHTDLMYIKNNMIYFKDISELEKIRSEKQEKAKDFN